MTIQQRTAPLASDARMFGELSPAERMLLVAKLRGGMYADVIVHGGGPVCTDLAATLADVMYASYRPGEPE